MLSGALQREPDVLLEIPSRPGDRRNPLWIRASIVRTVLEELGESRLVTSRPLDAAGVLAPVPYAAMRAALQPSTWEGAGMTLMLESPGGGSGDITALQAQVDDIEAAVRELGASGVSFEHYDEGEFKTDEMGIARLGNAASAWFKDPDGNIMSVIQE